MHGNNYTHSHTKMHVRVDSSIVLSELPIVTNKLTSLVHFFARFAVVVVVPTASVSRRGMAPLSAA